MRIMILLLTVMSLSAPQAQALPSWKRVKDAARLLFGKTDEAASTPKPKVRTDRPTAKSPTHGKARAGDEYVDNGPIIGRFTQGIKPNPDVIGEEAFMWELSAALMSNKASTPIITAEPGVGKTASWEYMQHLINKKDPRVRHLWGKKVEVFDLSAFMSATGEQGTLQSRIATLKKELKERDDIILVFDEFSNIFEQGGAKNSSGGGMGKELLNEIKTLMASSELKAKIGGNMTEDEYLRYLKDPAIQSRLVTIAKKEPSPAVVKAILQAKANRFMSETGLNIGPDIIEMAYRLSTGFPSPFKNPRKAEKLLEAMVRNAEQTRQAGPLMLQEMDDLVTAAKGEIKTIEDGMALAEAGDPEFSKYLGPYYRKKLQAQKEVVEDLTKHIDEYKQARIDEDERMEELFALQNEIRAKSDRLRDLEEAADEAREELTDIVRENNGNTVDMDPEATMRATQIANESSATSAESIQDAGALADELDVLREQARNLATEISESNSLLIIDRVTQEDAIEGAARAMKQPREAVERMMKDNTSIKEAIAEIEARMAGQKRAIREVIEKIILKRRGASTKEGALGVLILGPSSVGKTYFSNLVAEMFTFNQSYLMRMNEIMSPEQLTEHLGSSSSFIGSEIMGPLYQKAAMTNGLFTLIVDEPDKGTDAIYSILMNILREGTSQAKNGERVVDFSQALVMLPSNAVTEIDEATKRLLAQAGADDVKRQAILKEYVKRAAKENGVNYSEGFLNRVHVVFMEELEMDELRSLARLELEKDGYLGKLQAQNQMALHFDDGIVEYVVQRIKDLNGDASMIQEVIDGDISRYFNELAETRRIVPGDEVTFTVTRNANGEPELGYALTPWDDITAENSRTYMSRVYSYPEAMRMKEWFGERISTFTNDIDRISSWGLSQDVAQKVAGRIEIDDVVVETLPDWMKSASDFEKMMGNLGLEDNIAAVFNKIDPSTLRMADSIEIEVLPVDPELGLEAGIEVRVVATRMEQGEDGEFTAHLLNRNGEWVTSEEALQPMPAQCTTTLCLTDGVPAQAENVEYETSLPTGRVPTSHMDRPDHSLFDTYVPQELRIVEAGRGAAARMDVVWERVGVLKQTVSRGDALKSLKRARQVTNGGL